MLKEKLIVSFCYYLIYLPTLISFRQSCAYFFIYLRFSAFPIWVGSPIFINRYFILKLRITIVYLPLQFNEIPDISLISIWFLGGYPWFIYRLSTISLFNIVIWVYICVVFGLLWPKSACINLKLTLASSALIF